MPDFAYQELAELWEAVFGEQPSIVAEPGLTAQIMVSCLPPAEPYSFAAESEDGEGQSEALSLGEGDQECPRDGSRHNDAKRTS